MKVFIDDGMRISLGTGIGKYTQNLYESLRKVENIDVTLSDFKASASNRKLKRLQYLAYINSKPFYEQMGQYDVVHFCGQFFPMRKNPNTKYIATVHDLVAFVHPETLKPLTRAISREKIKRIVRDADAVLTVSESVKKELIETFPKYRSKFHAVYPGNYNDVSFVESGTFTGETLSPLNQSPFFLFVGTLEKRKNIGLIIDAFIKLRQQDSASSNYKLVLAGRPGFGFSEFQEAVKSSGFENDVIFTGYISNFERNLLYSRAAAYIFPTVYEGFGSTQLECMACHTPLILSDIPTNREISKDYGIYFELNNPQTLVSAMDSIVHGKYDNWTHKALAEQYLKCFEWCNLIAEYISVYKQTIKSIYLGE